MAEEFNEELMKQVGHECLRILDTAGLSMAEQFIVVDAMLDSIKRTALFYAAFGDEADEIMEKLIKADAMEAVEEAEDVLKGEM